MRFGEAFFRQILPLQRVLTRWNSQRTFSSKDLKWPVSRVRDDFVNYFSNKHNHVNYRSSPCVPVNDPTLLFANAGMNQFKPIFIGTVDPSSPLAKLQRAVNSQKCIRAGGKHNDLEDVGKDTYHHTFFEMLGTWSFGDYFKKEAIEWAYDILVNHYRLDPNRLYASYFAGDEALGLPCDNEAKELWLQFLPPERVLPFDKKANFWEMGDTGPCGPCTEIHYDRIGNRNAAHLVNADDPDVIEIWNLVFIQYNRETNGKLSLLPNKHIDTGMGLERLTSILQNVRSNYDTDAFQPIFHLIQEKIGCSPYTGKIGQEDALQNYQDTAYRVIADHVRTLTFAITDGAYPSDKGRGYVLRRILRRAIRYGMQTLHANPGFLSELIPIIPQLYGDAYPELHAKLKEVISVVKEEEASFSHLLEKGTRYFDGIIEKNQESKLIKGEEAFHLYSSLGFPVDLTQLMAAEKGFSVDIERFHLLMKEQQEKSKQAHILKKSEVHTQLQLTTDDISYLQKTVRLEATQDKFKYDPQKLSMKATLKAIYLGPNELPSSLNIHDISNDSSNNKNPVIGILLDKTNFYAESGGQVADTGKLLVSVQDGKSDEKVVLDVIDTQVHFPLVSFSLFCLFIHFPASSSSSRTEDSFSILV
jgi:alanyl-tRNA synthetase